MRTFIISENDAGQRADKFLTKAVPSLPSGLLHKYLRLKRIKRNGKRLANTDKLIVGDVLELYINDEFFEEKRTDHLAISSSAEIEIAYEDENILLLDKPAGLLCHEDEGEKDDTLAARMCAYLIQSGQYDPSTEHSFVPALCNRIDRNTRGLVIAAKNAESQRILNQKIKDRELEKYYLCITCGIPSPRSGTIRNFLFKDAKKNHVYVHETPIPGARTAITNYQVLDTRDGFALCEVELVTGRTHQIRAHFAHIGCPLLGDGKYGRNDLNRKTGHFQQMLQSHRLIFKFTSDAGRLSYLNGKEFFSKCPLTLNDI